jgi:trans-aconitate methyltransferase
VGNIENGCLACKATSLSDLTPGADRLGSTTRADGLHPFRLMHCPRCGLIQKSLDREWRAALDGLYDRHYEDYRVLGRQIGFVDGKVVGRDELAAAKLDDLLNLGAHGALLDIGCGAGRFLAAFVSRKPDWSVAGYDVGDAHREQVLAVPGATFFSGVDSLSNQSARFDLITLTHVLEHLTEPVEILKSAAALLAPRGRLVVRVPCFLDVNTDFFILEHCSHFTMPTLIDTLASAGLAVTQELTGIAEIEIGVVAQKPVGIVRPAYRNPAEVADQARLCLAWAETLPEFVRSQGNGCPKGLFGVGGAGIWLGVQLRGEISFFVDEDPGKQGHRFAGCPILDLNSLPDDATVFVTFNNPEASARIGRRLATMSERVRFAVPPPVERRGMSAPR